MGPEKRKRKSATALTAEPAKERRLEDDFPKWEDHCGYTVLQAANQQSVLFTGEAWLQVLHGAVRVGGKLVGVESPPLQLSTGGRFSLAITITAEAAVTQIPLAASPVVEVSLQSRPALAPPPQQQQQQQQRGGQQRQAGGVGGVGGVAAQASAAAGPGPGSAPTPFGVPTFSLHRPGDARAPASLLVSREWSQAVDELCAAAASGSPLVVAVLGPKGAGKSSLARLAANRLLDEVPAVAFLDADVGQPEFTPPGLVALHVVEPHAPALGPPHAHSRQPQAARFVGDVSPQHDPQLYLAAVQAMYGTYWDWAQSVVGGGGPWPPLVVNTHGWVKGLGFDLVVQLLRLVAPTHVVQMRCGSDKKNLPRGAFWVDPRDGQAAAPAALLTLDSLVDTALPPAAAAAAAQQQQQQAGPGSSGGGGGPSSSRGGGGTAPADSERARDASGPGRPRGGGGGGTAPGPPAAAARVLKPVESRALAWHAWAKRVVGWEPAWGSYESDDFWRVAGALASAAPFRASLDSLHVQLLGGSLHPHQLGRVLNGAVVGLLATQRPPPPTQPQQQQQQQRPGGRGGLGGGPGGGGPLLSAAASRGANVAGTASSAAAAAAAAAASEAAAAAAWCGLDEAAAAAAYPPGRISYAAASASSPPPLLPCLGVGIVRAVDMASRTLYLLTDVQPELLQCVGCLAVGRLELPGSLVVGGEVAWPYQQLFGLSAEATGAGAGRARKNLSRSSLVELAG